MRRGKGEGGECNLITLLRHLLSLRILRVVRYTVYSLVFVSIEKIYQTDEHTRDMFHRLSKHLEFRLKYSAERRIFNSLLCLGIPMKHHLS